jgi:hypothetical protein
MLYLLIDLLVILGSCMVNILKRLLHKVVEMGWTPRCEEEQAQSLTENDRYQLAVDTGTLAYYNEALRREAFQRDKE